MKTRVMRFYNVATGVWLYSVDCWYPIAILDTPVPRFWWPWPYKPPWEQMAHGTKIFETPNEEQARRLARDLSEGKPVEPDVLCEFADGVEFRPPT